MKTGKDYFIDFKKDLKKYTDDQLIARFNLEVNNKGSGTARFAFLAALHSEFNRRGFDYSEIGDKKSPPPSKRRSGDSSHSWLGPA